MSTIADTIKEEHAALMDSCGKPSYEQLEAQRDALREALAGVAGDDIAMRAFHEQFRAQIRNALEAAQ